MGPPILVPIPDREVRGAGPHRLRQDAAREPQDLADRPGLERTAARRMRRITVRDLRHVLEPGGVEVMDERLEEKAARLAPHGGPGAAHPHPRLDERAEKPRPRGALV